MKSTHMMILIALMTTTVELKYFILTKLRKKLVHTKMLN